MGLTYMDQSIFFSQDPLIQQPKPEEVGVVIPVQGQSMGFQEATRSAAPVTQAQIPENGLLQMATAKKLAETGQQSQLDAMASQPAPQPQGTAPTQTPPQTMTMGDVTQPKPQQTQPVTPNVPEMKNSVLGKDISVTARANQPYLNGRINMGTDFEGPQGTPIALPNGEWEVLDARNDVTARRPEDFSERQNYGWGNSVMVRNAQTGEVMRFSHMQAGSVPNLKPGEKIEGGKVIGAIGNTGNTHGVTGNHLDLEYYDSKGRRQDVLNTPYAQAVFSAPAQPPAAPKPEKVQVTLPPALKSTQSAAVQAPQVQPPQMMNNDIFKLWGTK